jgi:multidrug resistance protein MdtO
VSAAVSDVSATTDRPRATSSVGSLWTLLQAELSSYPGRALLVFRIVLACTCAMLCVIVFRMPGAALGAYFPLLISRDNLHSTRRSALWIAVACILGTAEAILGAMLFLGSPFLHLVWVCVSLCAIFYFISILRVYEAALSLGLVMASAITTWDQPVSANWRLEQILFTLLAILIGCAATVGIEHLFAQTHAPDAVIAGIQRKLALSEKVLRGCVDGDADWRQLVHDVRRYASRGTGALRELVMQAGYGFEEQQRLGTALSLSGRLIDLTASLTETERFLTEHDRELCTVIKQNVALIRKSLSRAEITDWIDIEAKYETATPILIEMERTVGLLAESLSQQIWDGGKKDQPQKESDRSQRLFVSDAFSNRAHAKFAIRGGLSAIVCYLFYMSVGWIGLSASVATCILTALPNTGAARHKQLMRFAGVVLGACAIGFSAQIIVLPQIDSILSYMLLFATVIFMGAWIATSGPRIAYCGVQIVLAYELVNLNRFSLNPSLVPARDTVLGIVLGVAAMWLIFDHLWATSSTESLRSMLASTILEIAELKFPATTDTQDTSEILLAKQTRKIMRNFERLRTLVDVSIFEAFPKAPPDEVLIQRSKHYLPQLRALLLLKTGLMHHQTVSENYCQSDIAVQVQQRCSRLLSEAAQHIEVNSLDLYAEPTHADYHLQQRLRSDAARIHKGELDCDLTELRLCSSLFDVVCHLTKNS